MYLFLVAPAFLKQSDLSSHYSVCMFACLIACLIDCLLVCGQLCQFFTPGGALSLAINLTRNSERVKETGQMGYANY